MTTILHNLNVPGGSLTFVQLHVGRSYFILGENSHFSVSDPAITAKTWNQDHLPIPSYPFLLIAS